MANVFQTSISGMLAAQRALATTSHNISNVNTDGYSRQRVEYGTRPAQMLGSGYIGTGVNVDTVTRMFDAFREEQVRTNTSEYGRLQTYADLAGRMDDLLADESAGLSPALQGFFDSVQEVASDPTSGAARDVMLAEGQNLAARFNFLDQRFADLQRDVNQRVHAQVEEVNGLAASIAELNKEIVIAEGRVGQPPNDLLDQRDKLVRDLGELVGARVQVQDDGQYNVFIGNGQVLVNAADYNQLKVTTSPLTPGAPAVAVSGASGDVDVTGTLSGGSIGGIFDFQREILEPAREDLNALADDFATRFNDQHRMGIHYADGTPSAGADFFSSDGTAGGLRVALDDSARIAVAGAAVAADGNAGSGGVGLDNPGAVGAGPFDLTLTYEQSSRRYKVEGPGGYVSYVDYDPDNPNAAGVPYVPGASDPALPSGMELRFSGRPEDGDSFTIRTVPGVGDNSNALVLGQLQERALRDGDTATPQETYSGMVASIGTDTMRAQVNRDAQEVMLNQAVAAQQETSGVNLDEEAANLLKFQQAYEASAQAINIANSLFDSLLQAVRR